MDDHTDRRSRLELPTAVSRVSGDVAAWYQPVEIDTYEVAAPSAFPEYLDSRVYQGSSGRVYPLPFHERVETVKAAREWNAVHLENDFVRLVILPDLGGRIHVGYDKLADYDFFYRNNVIKPALVGLAGPWISGGVEFNWPHHHRPATYLPTQTTIEQDDDGSVTVWCSDHDPFTRMKGMHGIRLRPDSSLIEARVRLYNRSETTQSFLWWANVAAAANDRYQSFFPPDVSYVADHARRAVVEFPHPDVEYYGVAYGSEPGHGLDWFRNIPVPTSYMVTDTAFEFFGGYDHGREAGFVHWAPRDISPGKKQWTWGNSDFGRAWDRQLTDDDGPYVELMAGVYTDNQPDFALLDPGETKEFSQFWYPISKIGVPTVATTSAAMRVELDTSSASARIGVAPTRDISAELVVTDQNGAWLSQSTLRLRAGHPVIVEPNWDHPVSAVNVGLVEGGQTIVESASSFPRPERPASASAPPTPSLVPESDELVLIAEYLRRYHHATWDPEAYLREALERDPHDSRASCALAEILYLRADYQKAVELLEMSIGRRTKWTRTPADGYAHYLLGLARSRRGDDVSALAAFGIAAWDSRYTAAAELQSARLHARLGSALEALRHARKACEANTSLLQARNLSVAMLSRLGNRRGSGDEVERALALDPLDTWTLSLTGRELGDDATILLDVACEYMSIGANEEALSVLEVARSVNERRPLGQVNVGPLVVFYHAMLSGWPDEADALAMPASRNCLASRLDDVSVLETALEHRFHVGLAHALLGHWYYDRGRYDDAVKEWLRALDSELDSETEVVVRRNLGLASYNHLRDPAAAVHYYESARALAPDSAKLLLERDELAERTGEGEPARLRRLESRRESLHERDDLMIRYVGLLLDAHRTDEAITLMEQREFRPWEGGEGRALEQWDRAMRQSAAMQLSAGDAPKAIMALERAVRPPENLGEARHPLASKAHLEFDLGLALTAAGRWQEARDAWVRASNDASDFVGLDQEPYGPHTEFVIRALVKLNRSADAVDMLDGYETWARLTQEQPAEVDFFATSMPDARLFADPPNDRRDAAMANHEACITELRRVVGPRPDGRVESPGPATAGAEL